MTTTIPFTKKPFASSILLWGVETAIPADRKIDGVAEVTFQSTLSPLLGRKQTRLDAVGQAVGVRVRHPRLRRVRGPDLRRGRRHLPHYQE